MDMDRFYKLVEEKRKNLPPAGPYTKSEAAKEIGVNEETIDEYCEVLEKITGMTFFPGFKEEETHTFFLSNIMTFKLLKQKREETGKSLEEIIRTIEPDADPNSVSAQELRKIHEDIRKQIAMKKNG